jgi:UDP-N-acetylglucosamine--N-acetylmuramyl-(pentapeptide) pyrophosphoryl-undecaprenol N-acetylglucosamine transferase
MDKYSKNKNITHYHVTGERGYKEYGSLFKEKDLHMCENLFLSEYLFDIYRYYAAADIVVCRAGALTLSELAALKKPAVLIPSPYVAENHQYKNAKVLERQKAAVIIEEKDLTAETLVKTIEDLMENPLKLSDMAQNIGKFAAFETLDKIYETVMSVKNKK